MDIEKINIEDYPFLDKIGKECLPISYDTEDIIFLDKIEKNNLMLKGVVNENIIGFIFCSFNKEINNIHINSFAIKAEYRRKGYGKDLIDFIKKYKTNITLNVLETNDNAIHFYKAQGFILKQIKKKYYETLNNKDAFFFEYLN